MADSLFLGLDVGTSGVKAIFVSPAGEVVASATTPISLSTPRPGWAEQDPEEWWQATVASIQALLKQKPGAEAASIGISGQMHSSVFLDAQGKVIRPALLWCDGRTTAECQEITRRVGGEDRMRDTVSNPALEGFTLPKVLWLRNHEPQAFARLDKVMLAKDYIRYRLTGEMACEPSDSSGTLMFDTARLRWSEEVMKAADLPLSLLPPLGGSSEVLGRVTAEISALTGVPEGTPVVGGGADNACGAAGVGAVNPGEAVASWGTSGTVLAPTAQPLVDPRLRAHTFCHVAPNTWYVMGVVLTAGGAFSWYRDRLAIDIAGQKNADLLLNEEAADIPPGADGITFLPYLQGERTPHRDASCRGAFLGLSLAHSRAHMTRAVLEGICFAMRDSVSILQELGLSPGSLLLTGGGARSPFVRKLQSEVYGLPVQTVNREEGGSYGAALGKTQDLGVIEAVFFRERVPYRVQRWWKEEDRKISSNDKDGRLDAREAEAQAGAAQAPAPNEGGARDQSKNSLVSPPSSSPKLSDEYAATGMGRRTQFGVTQVDLDALAVALAEGRRWRPVRYGTASSEGWRVEFSEVVVKRRSVRHFNAKRPVAREDVVARHVVGDVHEPDLGERREEHTLHLRGVAGAGPEVGGEREERPGHVSSTWSSNRARR